MPNAAPVHRYQGQRTEAQRKAASTRRLSSAAYSHRWRKARVVFLAANPFCRFCLDRGVETLATQVDHIKDAADHPEIFFEESNWRALCGPCHSRRTATEQGFAKR